MLVDLSLTSFFLFLSFLLRSRLDDNLSVKRKEGMTRYLFAAIEQDRTRRGCFVLVFGFFDMAS
jgi:hypothetical protein